LNYPPPAPAKGLEKKNFEMPKRAASYSSQIKGPRESAGGRAGTEAMGSLEIQFDLGITHQLRRDGNDDSEIFQTLRLISAPFLILR
jgi:hypothetical protein